MNIFIHFLGYELRLLLRRRHNLLYIICFYISSMLLYALALPPPSALRAPAGTALIRPVATPSSPLLVRLAARRPVCGQLVVLPRSGVRVLAVPGAALRVIRSGRRAVTVRPG